VANQRQFADYLYNLEGPSQIPHLFAAGWESLITLMRGWRRRGSATSARFEPPMRRTAASAQDTWQNRVCAQLCEFLRGWRGATGGCLIPIEKTRRSKFTICCCCFLWAFADSLCLCVCLQSGCIYRRWTWRTSFCVATEADYLVRFSLLNEMRTCWSSQTDHL